MLLLREHLQARWCKVSPQRFITNKSVRHWTLNYFSAREPNCKNAFTVVRHFTFFISLQKPPSGIWRHLTGRTQRPLPSLCSWGRPENKDGHSGLIVWDIFDYFSSTTQRNLTKLDRKQVFMIPYNVLIVFALIRHQRLPPWPMICGDIFEVFLCNPWVEFDETWLEAKTNYSTMFVIGPILQQSTCTFNGILGLLIKYHSTKECQWWHFLQNIRIPVTF